VTFLAPQLLVLTAALLIDRIVGDPPALWRRLPHPVALAGMAIGRLDATLNDARQSFAERRRNGIMAAIAVVAVAAVAGTGLHRLLAALPGGPIVEAIVVAVLLAQKSLVEHVAAVRRALASGLEEGRMAVSLIVGRDVTVLDKSGVARAAVESAAENFSDGVVAPAFWYALLGLPGLLVYKAINTADSMIGHRSPRHEAFGWAAARSDDLLSYVPARLSALLIALAALPQTLPALSALRDAPKHKSPNAGWPEAALAGALRLAVGGPRRYGELVVDGAWLNAGGRRTADAEDIRAGVRLIDRAWALLLALVAAAAISLFAFGR